MKKVFFASARAAALHFPDSVARHDFRFRLYPSEENPISDCFFIIADLWSRNMNAKALDSGLGMMHP